VSRMDHALYLGRELQRAEACLEQGLEYVQD
jgi:dihydropteroate synthase